MNSIRLSSLNAPVSGVLRLVSLLCLALPLLAAPAREVAFVDGAVAGHEVLVAGVRPGVETVRLDPAGDALAQMAAWAETHSGYEAIHVVSHAAPGALRLGGASLDGAALRDPAVAGRLARLGRALNRGGDLLLYGCELAKGEAGAQFVAELAQVTGADVGASDNQTGAAAKGGDWVLEVHHGELAGASLLSHEAVASYGELLGVFDFAGGAYSVDGNVRVTQSVDHVTMNVTGSRDAETPATLLLDKAFSQDLSFTSTLMYSGDGLEDPGMPLLFVSFTFSSPVNLTSLRVDTQAAWNAETLIFSRTDGVTASVSHTTSGAWCAAGTVNVDWPSVTSFTITKSGGGSMEGIFIDEVVFSLNAAPVLDDSGTPVLTSLTEDQTTNGGQTVASFVGSSINDADSGAVEGIAIIAAEPGNGAWEYSTDNGGTWAAVGTVATDSALLLREADKIRFVPNGQASTVASLTYRAWDQTRGTAGTKVTTVPNGAVSAFSSATETASIAVSDVEDAPSVVGLAGDSSTLSPGAGAYIDAGRDAVVTDVDSTPPSTCTALSIVRTSGPAAGDFFSELADGIVLFGGDGIPAAGETVSVEGVAIGTVDGTADGRDGADLRIALNASATYANLAVFLRNVKFTTTAFGTQAFEVVLAAGVSTSFSAFAMTVSPDLGYSTTTFVEARSADGAIGTTATITLSGDTFVGGIGDPLPVSSANVPAGLTAVLVKASDTTATLGFTGKATAHGTDVGTVRVSLLDGAFAGGSAAAVTHSTVSDIKIDFFNTWAIDCVVPAGDGLLSKNAAGGDLSAVLGNPNGIRFQNIEAQPGYVLVVQNNSGEWVPVGEDMVFTNGGAYDKNSGEGITVHYGLQGDFSGLTADVLDAVVWRVDFGNDGALEWQDVINLRYVPVPGTPDLVAASDSGASSTDNLTNVVRPTFSGTAPAGATVRLYTSSRSDGAPASSAIGTATAGADGLWTVVPTLDLAPLAQTITARIWDAAQSRLGSPSEGLQVTIATGAPAVPTIGAVTATTVSGTAEPGSTVEVFNGGTSLGVAVADAEGHWSLTVAPLRNGTYSLTAMATDAAGNVSAASSASSWIIDMPAVATIARCQPGPVTIESTLEWRVTFTEAVTGVDLADFALTSVDGAATATLGTVTPGANAAEYFVTATGVAGVGTLRLDVKSSGTGIVDGESNALSGGFIHGQPYTRTLGTVPVAWGFNYDGQLGLGTTDSMAHPVPALVPSTGDLAGKTVVAVSAGRAYTLALSSDGKVSAWGFNGEGQLGNDSTTESRTPVAVIADQPSTPSALDGKTVVAVSAAYQHSLALCSDGTVAAWGENDYGRLGNGSTADSRIPVAVIANQPGTPSALDGKTVVAVSAGAAHSLALCSDGTVVAWGRNNYGQLGNNTLTDSHIPVAVDTTATSALFGRTVVAVSAGNEHSLALCSDGTVAAWGENDYGRLGNGSTADSRIPVAVISDVLGTPSALDGKKVVAVSAGFAHSLALCSDGTVVAWGRNKYGQLGNGVTEDSRIPVAVTSTATSALEGKPVAVLAAGSIHSLVLCRDGTAVGWGVNSHGQLGRDTPPTQYLEPVAVNTSAPSALVRKAVYALGSSCYADHCFALASPAAITAVATPTAGTYKAGDTLSFTLTTEQSVNVTGTPRLALTIGTVTRYATYASGSSTTSLVFTYTVADGETDADGIAVVSTSIDLNGGTITDAGGWPIMLALPAYELPVILVDTTAPDSPAITAVTPTTVSGTAEPGATVEVFLSGTSLGTTTADAEGHWSLTISPLADGDYSLTAQATDAALNTGTASSAGTYTVDTVAPALTSATLISDNATPTLAKAGDVVTLNFTADETLQTPTVTLAGESATANFDSGTNTWTATRTVAAGDAEGAVTFSIAYRDVAGNAGTTVSATTDSSAVTIDLTAPETTIDSAPGAWTGSLVMFEFAGEDGAGSGVASYEVSVNGADFAPANFREFFSDLPDGPYTLAVRAIDAAGNVDATPATFTWTVDTVAPTLTAVTLVSSNATPTLAKAGDTVALSFAASETLQAPTVTLVGESVTASYDNASGQWRATHTVAAGDAEVVVSFSIAYRDESGLAGLAVTATTDSSAVTIDLKAPETTIPANPGEWAGSNLVIFEFAGEDGAGSGVVSYEVSLDGADFAPSNVRAFFSGLADGPHILKVRAVDAAGNVDATPAMHRWTVDTIAPVAPTIASITSTGVSGRAEAGTTVEVFNGSTSMGTATADADGTWSLAVTLVDGTYSLTATSTDAAGHHTDTTAATTRTIDTVKPTLTAVTLVSNNATPTLAKAGDVVTLSFKASETLQTPAVTLAGATDSAAFDSATSTWRATRTVAAADPEGAVAFSIAFSDVAGNAGTAVTATTDSSVVTIDLTAPETTITSQPASLSASASATFIFGSADTAASFEASLDGAAYAAATSPATFTGLSEGAHTFAVRAVDVAGNVDATPASYTWTVDTVVTPPVVTPPATPTVPTTMPTITGTAEAGSTVRIYAGTTLLGTTTADATGAWSFTPSSPLADGEHTLTVTATDAAGNVSQISSLQLTIETTSRFAALSARGPVGTGEQTLTLGFVFGGSGSKATLLRGVGPGIAASVSEAVADPRLVLFNYTAGGWAEVGSNDDWAGAAALRSAFASTGAGALADDSKDAALVATLSDRIYTAQVTAGGSGVVLAETYDAALSDRARWLTALSVRNQVGTGAETLIAGFVIAGTQPKAVILRAVGPGLSGSVANYLANPEIKLWRLSGGEWTLVDSNDDWSGSTADAAAFASAGMGPLTAGSKDAALLVTLEPGIYTLQVNGAAGTSGVALAEIYEAAP